MKAEEIVDAFNLFLINERKRKCLINCNTFLVLQKHTDSCKAFPSLKKCNAVIWQIFPGQINKVEICRVSVQDSNEDKLNDKLGQLIAAELFSLISKEEMIFDSILKQ